VLTSPQNRLLQSSGWSERFRSRTRRCCSRFTAVKLVGRQFTSVGPPSRRPAILEISKVQLTLGIFGDV
jgi:hypothetical protein